MKKRLMFVATALILVIAVLFTGCGKEEKEKVSVSEGQQVEVKVGETPEEVSETSGAETSTADEAVKAKFCFHYKAGNNFVIEDVSAYVSDTLESAKIWHPTNVPVIMEESDEKDKLGNYYIQPEFRVYGIDLERYSVEFSYESEGTKEESPEVKKNNGPTEFFYNGKEIKMYDQLSQGTYSFKVKISNSNIDDDAGKDFYFKVVVVK